jgi:hypothetical protein
MSRTAGAAAKLPESERKKLAVRALAGSETVTDLAPRHGVSRKFVYAQKGKASNALNGAFCSAVVTGRTTTLVLVTQIRPILNHAPFGWRNRVTHNALHRINRGAPGQRKQIAHRD